MAKLIKGQEFPCVKVNTLYKGETTTHELINGKKTVFWFLRYLGCTVCRYDIHVASQRYEEIKEKDAQIVFVLQSKKTLLEEELKDVCLPFEIISDPDMLLYKEFEIIPGKDVKELLGGQMEKLQAKGAAAQAAGFSHGEYEGDELQLPAMFIVDPDRTIEYAKYAENIVDLPTIDELKELL